MLITEKEVAVMQCPFCHQTIPEGDLFCKHCGKQLPYCPTCGKPVEAYAKFCRYDGTPIPTKLLASFPEWNAERQAAQPPLNQQQPYQSRPMQPPVQYQSTDKPNVSSVNVLLTIIVIVLVLALAVGAYAIVSFINSERSPERKLQAPPSESSMSLAVPTTESRPVPTETETAETQPPTTEPPTTQPPIIELPYPDPLVSDTETRLEYFFENCDKEYFDQSYFQGFNDRQATLARNGLYARCGYIFNTEWISDYFMGCDWYSPTLPSWMFTADMFNKYQMSNLTVIANYEKTLP